VRACVAAIATRPVVRKKLDQPALLKKMRWTSEDFGAAQSYGFPAGGKRPILGGWGWSLQWHEDVVDAWVAKMRADVEGREALLRFVK
jgi:hypothetical protein